MISRRKFLKNMALGCGAACSAAAFGPLGSRYAFAQTAAGSGKTLIMFNLFGGCDPLNSFAVPHLLPEYYSNRPNLALPQNVVLPIGDGKIAFHPSLSNFKRMFDQGNIALIRGIGDPVGTRSHFTTQDIFSRGTTQAGDGRGWLGRLGDLYFEEDKFNTIGIGIGSQLDFKSDRGQNTPLVLQTLEFYNYRAGLTKGIDQFGENDHRQLVLKELTNLPDQKPTLIRTKVDAAQRLAQESTVTIQEAFSSYSPATTFADNGTGKFFEEVSVTLSANLGTKVFYGGLGGWDHHSNQGSVEGSQANLLAQVDNSIAAFEIEAKQKGWWDNTCICVFTEFGRKNVENGSGGTDHGWGSSMLMIGGGVKGGIYGPETTSADLKENWLPQHIDFRNPFSELVSWLGFNPAPVFPESFEKTNLGVLA